MCIDSAWFSNLQVEEVCVLFSQRSDFSPAAGQEPRWIGFRDLSDIYNPRSKTSGEASEK